MAAIMYRIWYKQKNDVNSGFDSSTGIVTIKESGVYFFTTTLRQQTTAGQIYLMKNDEPLCEAYTYGQSYKMLTCSVTIPVEKDDQIFVKLLEGEITWKLHSTFTGFMISASDKN